MLAAGTLVQILRQQGRILLRLEALERSASPASLQRAAGVAIGARFPDFRLPDPTGRSMSLADFAGRRVLLVNWSPSCGFCERIAPELATLVPAMKARKTELILVSSGNVDVNQALLERHALKCEIGLTDRSPAVAPFAAEGTPVAYALDERGLVTKGPIVGADRVMQVARELASRTLLQTERPLSESRLRRDGIPAGAIAPKFTLDDVYGSRVSLADYDGQRILLIFSDPHCGPCTSLLPHLARLRQAEPNRFRVVMVSRGDLAENRRKVSENGITFPVLLQPGWSVSKDYGIFATPSAFLIDEEGVVAEDVAVGSDAILALMRRETSVGEVAMKH